MATGYYILGGVTVAPGDTVLTATTYQVPGASTDPVNFANLVGAAGAEGTPAGFELIGPAGQIAIVSHALSATTLQLSRPWVGAAIAAGSAELVLGINALPIGRLATLITQIMAQRPLLKTNNLVEYLGDTAAQAAVRGNIGAQIGHANLTALAALTFVANRMLYLDGTGALVLGNMTAFGRSLIDDNDASTALSTLGVSAFVKTVLDDPDASTVLSTLGVSTFIKTLLDDANAATARNTLGVSLPALFTTAGGDESALTTSATFRLSLDFIPTGPNVMLLSDLDFDAPGAAAGVYTYGLIELYRVSSGALFSTSGEVTQTLQATAGYSQLSLHHIFAGLEPGAAYRAWLKPRVSSVAAGAICPRVMKISALTL